MLTPWRDSHRRFAPGVEAVIGIDNEGIRGRFLYVESGQLKIVPMVDSPIWLDGAALGGFAAIAGAGEEVQLEVGDLIFIPVIAVDDLVPGPRSPSPIQAPSR